MPKPKKSKKRAEQFARKKEKEKKQEDEIPFFSILDALPPKDRAKAKAKLLALEAPPKRKAIEKLLALEAPPKRKAIEKLLALEAPPKTKKQKFLDQPLFSPNDPIFLPEGVQDPIIMKKLEKKVPVLALESPREPLLALTAPKKDEEKIAFALRKDGKKLLKEIEQQRMLKKAMKITKKIEGKDDDRKLTRAKKVQEVFTKDPPKKSTDDVKIVARKSINLEKMAQKIKEDRIKRDQLYQGLKEVKDKVNIKGSISRFNTDKLINMYGKVGYKYDDHKFKQHPMRNSQNFPSLINLKSKL